MQFIVDNGSQKNLISAEVMKRLGLPTTPHPQPYSIGWLHEGGDLKVRQQCRLPYDIKPFIDEVLCDVTPLDVCDVLKASRTCGGDMLCMSQGLVLSLFL